MKYAVLFAGIVFGCSADPGGVTKPPPEPPGVTSPGPSTPPFDCRGALAQLGSCMTQADFDATAASVELQNTTEGPCYSCHSMGLDWFRNHPQLIAACAQNQLVYFDGIAAFGNAAGGGHPQFIVSTSRDQALHDFFDRTRSNCP
jgi:hypothetical protein